MYVQRRENNFNLLRLFFAFLVIISHSPALVDGNNSRELATRLWGTLSLGEMGVDGFFVVSGLLISQSFFRSSTLRSYLFKRILRIYPGFLVASAVVMVVVAPLAGATGPIEISRSIARALRLAMPDQAGVFQGLPFPTLNGSMWSIPYEFRCYLALIVLWAAGLLRRGWHLPVLAIAMLFATSLGLVPTTKVPVLHFLGQSYQSVRTLGLFLVGVSFYLERDRLPIRNDLAGVAAITLFCLLFFKPTAEPAFAVFGGYLILWLSRAPWLFPISQRLKADISYGLYLYAWPITSLLIYYGVTRSPGLLSLLTLAGAAICGWLSWTLVERPFLSLKGKPDAEEETRLQSRPES